jgi:hypothetical protein
LSGSTVYAGGNFTSIGGLARIGIAALDVSSGAVTTWNANANGYVLALEMSGGTLFVGGGFTNIGGQVRNRIVALDATSATATAWDPNANDYVAALALSNATVYAGGAFTCVGGSPQSYFAAISAPSLVAVEPGSGGTVALALEGARPNPTAGILAVWFRLANREAATSTYWMSLDAGS